MTNLVLLDLSVNKLTGDIPTTLGKCVELVQLQLNDNLLQGVIPQSLSGLQGIQELNFAGNNLSGSVPGFFGDWPNLAYLNLSYNNFEGPIAVKGVFSNASAFFIDGNKVCGGIPSLQLSHERIWCGEEETEVSSAYRHCCWCYVSASHSSHMWSCHTDREAKAKGPKSPFIGRSTLASLI